MNPTLLAGGAFVAAPIVLHLIMRRKSRHLEFPAMRFLQARHEANRRRFRLRHLVLLALRIAAIGLFAAALARPSLTSSGFIGDQEAPVAAAMVFDTSPRMEYRHQNQTRLQAAGDIGVWLLSQLPPESQVAVLDSGLGSAVFQVDLGAAKQRIERLESTAVAQPLTRVVEEALRLLADSGRERKEIYIFTDRARASWPADAAKRFQEQLARVNGVGLYVIDVGVEEPQNFALGELRLSGQFLSKNSPLVVETDLARQGPAAERDVELVLLEPDGTPRRRGRETLALGAGESRQVTFRIAGLDEGTHQGYVRIVGEDALAADDIHYFTVEVKPAWRVLIAAPKPVARYAFFLPEALAPEAFRKTGQAKFQCDVIALDQLANHSLAEYSAVWLLDPAPPTPETWQALDDFARKGGGVAISLGRNAQPVDTFNAPAAQRLLPGKLVRQARAPAGDLWLVTDALQHPALAGFRPIQGSIPWDAYPVFRYWELGEMAAGVGVVARYNDHRPAILERSVGKGRVLTMTTPISDPANPAPWNLLPTGLEPWPMFVLANGMASYLVGSGEEQLNYTAGQMAVLDLGADRRYTNYLLITPRGDPLRQTVNAAQNAIVVTATDRPGNYRVEAGGQQNGLRRGFSVNLASEASRLDRASREDLDGIFGPFEYRMARDRTQIDRNLSRGRVGRELYPYLIALVAIALALEHIVASRFYPEARASKK
ncbi:MAG: BatA domain-containing protein [Pirellulales bacterium]